MLDRNWSAKVEYLYMDFGSRNVTWAFTGLPTITDRIRLNENVVRAGVNYKF
jgi:opacity protein-like surface antigen